MKVLARILYGVTLCIFATAGWFMANRDQAAICLLLLGLIVWSLGFWADLQSIRSER